MECNNYTEICVHDSSTRVASLMYYDGVNNNIQIGRNKGWGEISNVLCLGPLTSLNTIRGAKYVCAYGETIAYNYVQNSRGLQGWFIVLNDFWGGNNGNGGCAYLTIAFYLVNTSRYWCFCRVLVNAGGGAGTIIIDSKFPTSGVYGFFI